MRSQPELRFPAYGCNEHYVRSVPFASVWLAQAMTYFWKRNVSQKRPK
jgi:hypothetical protein